MDLALVTNFAISIGVYIASIKIVPPFGEKLVEAHLFGYDLCKKHKSKVPESLGVAAGCVFMVAMFIFIPVPSFFLNKDEYSQEKLVELIVALLSICCMILLGFADDVVNLRWRHKVLLPAISTLPLLMVYYVNYNSTTIAVPKFARPILGMSLDIGVLYYIYMGMLAVFCTNAINILAGINGLEVGQSIVISVSIIIFNMTELLMENQMKAHTFSLYLILPFLATTLALWKYNKYPSKIFVGDTFCYFAGMTFAVVGILGHFSKTLLLFFLPQIINFLYSLPQLLHFVPCPRHRLPCYNSKTDLLHISTTKFKKSEVGRLGLICITIFRRLKLISCIEKSDGTVITNNFTLINFVIIIFGPVHESFVTNILIGVQVTGTFVAFAIRYPLANYFFD